MTDQTTEEVLQSVSPILIRVYAVCWCAYLDQLWQKNLKLSIWYLLKVVNCSAPHSLIIKTEKDVLSHQTGLMENLNPSCDHRF